MIQTGEYYAKMFADLAYDKFYQSMVPANLSELEIEFNDK